MIRRKTTLFDQGLSCIGLLLVGIANAPFIPWNLRRKLFPFILLGYVLMLALYHRHRKERGTKDIEREQRDERAQMLLEKSIWCCWQAEDWLLILLFVILGMCVQKYEIAYTLYWLLIGRCLLTFGIRWWLNRKY